MDPALPGGGERTVDPAGLERVDGLGDLLPGREIHVRVEPGRLEKVTVDPEHWRRRVVGQRQHFAVGGRIIALHRADERVGIECRTRLGHHLIDRHYSALGRHHCRRADLEDLEDMRLLAGPESGDACVERLGVVSLVAGNDDVVRLGGVEGRRLLVEQLVQPARHCVPKLDFGLGVGAGRHRERRRRGPGKHRCLHGLPPVCAFRASLIPDEGNRSATVGATGAGRKRRRHGQVPDRCATHRGSGAQAPCARGATSWASGQFSAMATATPTAPCRCRVRSNAAASGRTRAGPE